MNIGVKRWKNAINADVLSFGLNFHLKVVFFKDFLQFLTIPFTVRGVFRTFELRVLTVIDCPKIAGPKGQ